MIARNAVANRQPSDAAVTTSTESGSPTRLASAALIATRSANDPGPVNPGWVWSGHTCASPATQCSQTPHPQTNGTVTRSPTCQRVTSAPTSATVPARLVAGDVREIDGVVSLPCVPVGAAHARGADGDDDAVARAVGVRHLAHAENLVVCRVDRGLHAAVLVVVIPVLRVMPPVSTSRRRQVGAAHLGLLHE